MKVRLYFYNFWRISNPKAEKLTLLLINLRLKAAWDKGGFEMARSLLAYPGNDFRNRSPNSP